MFELLCDSSFGMGLGFLKYCLSRKVGWSRPESSWYPYNSDAGVVRFVEASLGPGWRLLRDGPVLADQKLSDVLLMFLNGGPMSLFDSKPQVRQFGADFYLADLEESPEVSRCWPVTWILKLIWI